MKAKPFLVRNIKFDKLGRRTGKYQEIMATSENEAVRKFAGGKKGKFKLKRLGPIGTVTPNNL